MTQREYKEFSDQIREKVASSKFTKYAISKETGIPQPTLSRFERGEAFLGERNLNKLAKLLGLGVKGGK
ncbi:helix-turn-helix domain-containing protein [Poriferisphaera sp. WC338]|uniref:helix-turn-helix domain-containing protein n=1 Tax=Poriferisphaera sp. WC338 TaxID=3425129 RepID=UPI003D81A6F2